MEKKRNIITLNVSKTKKLELDVDELQKLIPPSPKLEKAKTMFAESYAQKKQQVKSA